MNEYAKSLTNALLQDDPEIEWKIANGIDANRKGFGEIILKDADGNPIPCADIAIRQTRHEFHFGCNAFMFGQFPQQEQNEQYAAAFADLFNLAVIPFYWSDLEPEDGQLRFTKDSIPIYRRPAPDMVLEFCEQHHITPKGHPLCWQHFFPAWMPNEPQAIALRLDRRFREIAERYADKIHIWDTVNEAQSWNPLDRRFPENHIEYCFKLAERYFPGSTLLYNDDRIWWNYRGEYTPVYLLVRRLQEQGIRVGGLGLQFHMFDNLLPEANQFLNPRHLYACMDQYHKLGIPINFSEVSIISRRDLGDGDEFQRLVAEKLYRIWFSHPATNGIIWWNMVDGTAAYAPLGSEDGENSLRAGLLNYDFSDKPACSALRHLIHKEWMTNTTLDYVDGAVNKFHGFFGNYTLTISTKNGSFEKQVMLGKNTSNVYELEVR